MPLNFRGPIQGLEEEEVVEQPLPVGIESAAAATAPAPAAAAPYQIQDPAVKDHMAKLFGERYSDKKRQELLDESGPSVLGSAISGLGATLAGRDGGARYDQDQKMGREAQDAKLAKFDSGRASLLENSKQNRAMRDDLQSQEKLKSERDPTSDASRLAQQAALKMGINPEIASKMTAEQFKSQGSIFEKIFQVEQSRLARQDAAQARKDAKGGTQGQIAADKDYAKDYNDFTGGGQTKAVNALEKLKSLREQMAADNGLVQAGGGPISGSLPDWARTQKSISQRDNIVSAANSALKATFGGQLSDGERKALANEFYNDRLSNDENLKIIDRKISELRDGLQTQGSKAKYFADRGTLTGFQGVKSSPQDPLGGGQEDHSGAAAWLSDPKNKSNPNYAAVKKKFEDSTVKQASNGL